MSKEYGSATLIAEVGWAPNGRTSRREMSRKKFLGDLVLAERMGSNAHEWRGQSPDGAPLVIWWLASQEGQLMSAYEHTANGGEQR